MRVGFFWISEQQRFAASYCAKIPFDLKDNQWRNTIAFQYEWILRAAQALPVFTPELLSSLRDKKSPSLADALIDGGLATKKT